MSETSADASLSLLDRRQHRITRGRRVLIVAAVPILFLAGVVMENAAWGPHVELMDATYKMTLVVPHTQKLGRIGPAGVARLRELLEQMRPSYNPVTILRKWVQYGGPAAAGHGIHASIEKFNADGTYAGIRFSYWQADDIAAFRGPGGFQVLVSDLTGEWLWKEMAQYVIPSPEESSPPKMDQD